MNTYYIEVIGSQWPIKKLDTDQIIIKDSNYSFVKYIPGSNSHREVALYPINRTIITDIDYHIDL
jgi:hypothetical protein